MPAIKLRNNNVHTLNPVVSSFSPLYALYTLIVIGIHQINGIKHQPIPIVEIKHKIKAANFIGTPFITSFSFYPPGLCQQRNGICHFYNLQVILCLMGWLYI